jgi:hypothetical protein
VDGDAQMEGGVVDDEEDQAGSAGTLGVNKMWCFAQNRN